MKEETQRDDRHFMPWLIPAIDDEPLKDCVLVATMHGNEMQSISLHVAFSPSSAGGEGRLDS